MEQTIENFTGTKNVNIGYTEGDVQAGIEFIYHMREHLLDVGVATVFALTVYGLVLVYESKDKMSEALKTLQEKIGSTPDGSFGPNTAKKICDHYVLNPERGVTFSWDSLFMRAVRFVIQQENLNYSKESILGSVW